MNNKWMRAWFIVIFAASLVITIGIPFLFNTRANMLIPIIDLAFITYLSRLRVRIGSIGLLALLAIAAFLYMTLSRVQTTVIGILDVVMGQPYLLDFTKVAHILNYFSETGLRFYGETLVGWVLLPVPEWMFNGHKPMFVEMGKYIGANVYGYELTGVPPGFIGELYMNGGYLAVVIGMLVIGILMKSVWHTYVRYGSNIIVTTAVAMILVRFSVFLFNNDFGTFMLKNILETFPVGVALWIATRGAGLRQVRSEPQTAASS